MFITTTIIMAVQFTLDSNVLDTTYNNSLNASQIQNYIRSKHSDSMLLNSGQTFIDMANKYGLNILFVVGHACVESSWGRSFYARDRNNLFGIGAVDSNPNAAFRFPSIGSCLDYYGNMMRTLFFDPNNWRFNGYGVKSLNPHYCSSTVEPSTILWIMNDLANSVNLTNLINDMANVDPAEAVDKLFWRLLGRKISDQEAVWWNPHLAQIGVLAAEEEITSSPEYAARLAKINDYDNVKAELVDIQGKFNTLSKTIETAGGTVDSLTKEKEALQKQLADEESANKEKIVADENIINEDKTIITGLQTPLHPTPVPQVPSTATTIDPVGIADKILNFIKFIVTRK